MRAIEHWERLRYASFRMRLSSLDLHTVALGTAGIMVVVVAWQALTEAPIPNAQPPEPIQACIGEPIIVDYEYGGSMMDPWECEVQCKDGIQRYIYYTNGKATQCELLPGCLDWGEDKGILCDPPAQTPV